MLFLLQHLLPPRLFLVKTQPSEHRDSCEGSSSRSASAVSPIAPDLQQHGQREHCLVALDLATDSVALGVGLVGQLESLVELGEHGQGDRLDR